MKLYPTSCITLQHIPNICAKNWSVWIFVAAQCPTPPGHRRGVRVRLQQAHRLHREAAHGDVFVAHERGDLECFPRLCQADMRTRARSDGEANRKTQFGSPTPWLLIRRGPGISQLGPPFPCGDRVGVLRRAHLAERVDAARAKRRRLASAVYSHQKKNARLLR